MSKKLKQVINLSKKTGDRIIVFDNNNPENSFVLMSIEQYEDLLKIPSSKKEELEIENPNNNLSPNLKEEEKKDSSETKEEPSSQNFQKEKEEIKNFPEEGNDNLKEEAPLEKKEDSPKISSDLNQKLNDGPLKETLQNLLTEKKIIDKINNIEKNNINSSATSSFKGNNWKIPLDVKEDSE